MARSTPTALDDARRVQTGTLAALGARSPAITLGGDWNLTIFNTFSAAVRLDRSFDGGTTWVPCTQSGLPVQFTVPASEIVSEIEPSVLYSLVVTIYNSGTVSWRASQ